MPLAAIGQVRLEFNGGGGGNRTRVRKPSRQGVYMFSQILILIVAGSSGQDPAATSFPGFRLMAENRP